MNAPDTAPGTAQSPDLASPPSPAERLFQLIRGYGATQITAAIAGLGIADAIAAGTRVAREIAASVKADPGAVERLLRAGAALGLVIESPSGSFALTDVGEGLRSGVRGSLRDLAVAQAAPGHWLPWGRFLDVIRSGRTQATAALGGEIWSYYKDHPEEGACFARAMGNLSALVGEALGQHFDASRFSRIVDVGGSQGVILEALLRANPAARGVLFDLPEIAEGGRARLAEVGLGDRVEVEGGSFFERVPAGGDLYVMKHIVHDWDDPEALRILRRCRSAIAPHGRLLLIEGLLPDDGQPSPAALMDMTMLVMLSGRERSESAFRKLLREAGFGLERVAPLGAGFFALESVPG